MRSALGHPNPTATNSCSSGLCPDPWRCALKSLQARNDLCRLRENASKKRLSPPLLQLACLHLCHTPTSTISVHEPTVPISLTKWTRLANLRKIAAQIVRNHGSDVAQYETDFKSINLISKSKRSSLLSFTWLYFKFIIITSFYFSHWRLYSSSATLKNGKVDLER